MNDESREPFKRLFFALNCAPAQRREIAQWRSALQLRNGRPVPAENFHLTLKFLGAVGAAQIADICTAAAAIRTPGERLTVVLDRLDVWRRAGALVLAPEQAPPGIVAPGVCPGTGDVAVRAGGSAKGIPSASDPGTAVSGTGAGVRNGAGILPACRPVHPVRIPQGPLSGAG